MEFDFDPKKSSSNKDKHGIDFEVDFPAWMVRELDQEAERLGVTRQSIIKFWISERLNLSHT